MKILLDVQASPDKKDEGEIPLSHAARNGHDGVVKILFERYEVNPNHPGRWSTTPLMSAAQNGHEGVVEVPLRSALTSHVFKAEHLSRMLPRGGMIEW